MSVNRQNITINVSLLPEKTKKGRLEQSIDRFRPPIPKTNKKIHNFRAKPVNHYSLENFIEILETDIFRPTNYKRIRNNLSIEERKSLQELRSLNDLL